MNSENYVPPIYSTLLEAGLCRIYTPADAYDPAYTHDIEWFSMHIRPKRQSSVRAMIGREFDTLLSPPYFVSSPTLWMWVNELSPGVHAVLPIWRGDKFFRTYDFKYADVADVRSDSEIAMLLYECSRRVRSSITELYGKAGSK
jgi:hypothetical protein